jgi:hypothetical protein
MNRGHVLKSYKHINVKKKKNERNTQINSEFDVFFYKEMFHTNMTTLNSFKRPLSITQKLLLLYSYSFNTK